MTKRLFMSVFMLLTVMLCVGGQAEKSSQDQYIIDSNRSLKLIPRAKKTIIKNGAHLMLPSKTSKGYVSVPVVLDLQEYRGEIIKKSGRQTNSSYKNVLCYTLHSTDKSHPFSWNICKANDTNLYRPRVFNYKHENYLVYVSGYEVHICKISMPRSMADAIKAEFDSDERLEELKIAVVPVVKLAGSEPFKSNDAQNENIRLKSLSNSKDGNLMLTVTGSQSKKEFTFVRKDSIWHLR